MILQKEEDAVTAKPKGLGGVAQLTKLMEEAGVGGRGRHSPLSRWMQTHHDTFATMLADEDPSWNKVAVGFAKMKVHDGQGRPRTGECVRKTWWSVRQARAKSEAAKSSKTPQPLVPGEIAPGVWVSELDPVDVQPPQEPLEPLPAIPTGTVATSNDRPAAGSTSAPPAIVADDAATASARLILDGGDGDGLAHGDPSPDVVPSPSMTDQALPGMPAGLERESEETKATQTGSSSDVGPAAPALAPGAAEALPDLSPTPATLAPAPTPGPAAPATQNPAVVTHGKVQKPSRLWGLLKRST